MISYFLSSLVATMIAGSGPVAPEPIQLVADRSADGVHLRVVGSTERAFEAIYTLEVESEAGNRSVQRGRAMLRPGQNVTLISVRLGDIEPKGWEARLLVEPLDGEAYRQVRSAT